MLLVTRWMMALLGALASPSPAQAAPGDPCATPPAAATPGLHALRVVVTPVAADGSNTGMARAPGAEFPAISEDGRTVALYFEDSQDFTGLPLSDVVFVTATGAPIATYGLGGNAPGRDAPAQVVARVNARLAASRWRTLPAAPACVERDADGTVTRSRVAFAHGHAFAYDPATGLLAVTDAGRTRTQPVELGRVGTRMGSAEDGGGDACGQVDGFASAVWIAATRTLLVVPRGSLGGDSCFGASAAESFVANEVL